MSDALKHECGIAQIRLLKPLEYYKEKYGTAFYGVNKMYLMMEKQHNRGQDGAGFASIKLNTQPGDRYISRVRSNAAQPIQDIFAQINDRINEEMKEHPEYADDVAFKKSIFLTWVNCSWGMCAMAPLARTVWKTYIPFFARTTGCTGTSSWQETST